MKKIKIEEETVLASEISLGCMRISELSVKEVANHVNTALEEGINLFEHAIYTVKVDAKKSLLKR